MITWMNRITMSDEAAQMAFEGKNEAEVDFTYINTKTGKESTHKETLHRAILLAESRRDDGRYKNYEFHIG